MEKYDSLVAYLLIDYIIAIACKHFPEIRKEYEQIPVNQTGLWLMLHEMNKPYDKNKWNQAIQTADFWKLSYKDDLMAVAEGKNRAGRTDKLGIFSKGSKV